jgi:hypothetical protein
LYCGLLNQSTLADSHKTTPVSVAGERYLNFSVNVMLPVSKALYIA